MLLSSLHATLFPYTASGESLKAKIVILPVISFNCPTHPQIIYCFHFILPLGLDPHKHTHTRTHRESLVFPLCNRGLNTFELLCSKNLCLSQDYQLPRKPYPAVKHSQRFGEEKNNVICWSTLLRYWVLFLQCDNLLNSHTSNGFKASGHCL